MCTFFSTVERWSKPQEHWPNEEFCDTLTEIRQTQTHMPSILTVAKQESCILVGSSMHEWCLVCSSCGCKMAFSDGEIKYFSWRLGVAWSCGKDIWHVESCYLQYSMWKNFRPALYICRRVENASLGLNNKWKVLGPSDFFLQKYHNRNTIGPRDIYLLIYYKGTQLGCIKGYFPTTTEIQDQFYNRYF